jgi:hypothetical protein
VNLSEKLDGGLGTIGIRSLHVKIVHKVDEDLGTKTSLDFFSLVDKLQLKIDLHIRSSGVRVEIDVGEGSGFWVSGFKEILDDDSLTSTGVTNEENGFSSVDMVLTELLKSASLDGMDQDLAE